MPVKPLIDALLSYRTSLFAITGILLAPVFGSVSSAIIFAVAIIGFFMALGTPRLLPASLAAIPSPVLWSAAAFAAFFAAELLAGLVHWNGLVTLGEIGENIAFLGLLPCYMLFAQHREELLKDLLRAAPWCAFAALALTLYQFVQLQFRPQGGAGNPGVFAVTVAILLAFTLAGALAERQMRWRAVALAGVLAACAALILSGTRALWPCLIVFPAILWLLSGGAAARRRAAKAILPATIAIVLVAIAFSGMFRDAYRLAVTDIDAWKAGHYETRLGKRFAIWQAGVEAIPEHPVIGHGLDAPRRIMAERTPAIAGVRIAYSHFHDFILNEMIRAGILGTAALLSMFVVPFAMARRGARRDETSAIGFGLLACVQAAFLFSGLVSIMLDHDVLDSQFLANTTLCLFLIFGPAGSRASDIAPDRPGGAGKINP